MTLRIVASVLTIGLAAPAYAQVLPLVPVTRPLPTNSVLLTFHRSNDTVLAGTQIKIKDGKLYLMMGNRVSDEDLGDESIADFIRDFTDEHQGLTLSTRHPELPVANLQEGIYAFPAGHDTFSIRAREPQPSIGVGGGIGFIANEVAPRDARGSLMRNAGLALDVVATKPFDWVTLRARVGFHSAEPVPTEQSTDSAGVDEPDTPPQQGPSIMSPRSVVETAQAVAVGFSIDIPVPYAAKISDQMHVSVGADLSQYWASPDEFTFPDSVPLSGGRTALTSVFTEAQIQRARNQMDRILPLATVTTGVRLLFGGPDNYVFYLLSDVGWRDYLSRRLGVRYRRAEGDSVATPVDLSPRVEVGREMIARYVLGIRLTGGVDFKVDVTRPFSRGEFEPNAPTVLRLMIGTPGLSLGN